MALIKLTDVLTKQYGAGFSLPTKEIAPSHLIMPAVTGSGFALGPSAPVTFVNAPATLDDLLVAQARVNLFDEVYILPAPPVSDRKLRLASGSTSQEPKAQGSTLSSLEDQKMKAAPLIRLSGQEGPVRRFKVLQTFEGKVTEVYDKENSFRADLIDLTDKTSEQESAEFLLDEIHPDDRELVSPGSVFYWIMGYERTASDYKRVSEIRLRRSPRWSEHEIDAITREGKELFKKYTGGKEHTTAD